MKNIEEQESEYVAKHNRDATPTEWLEGSRVYIESVVPPGKSKKLFKRFTGPYRIMKKLENERYVLQDLQSGKEKQVHSDRMKPVLESERGKSGKVPITQTPSQTINQEEESLSSDEESQRGRPMRGRLKPPERTRRTAYELRNTPMVDYRV